MRKLLQYIRYFFFIASNWGVKIAIVLIQHEIRGEKKYGISTTGADSLKSLRKKGIDISHATMYMPVSYQILEAALQHLPSNHRMHFFDIGCGKGRATCVAAYYGFKKVSGIDFSKEFCNAAIDNLSKVSKKIPALQYSIIEADAASTNIPVDTDCIFLFNPFDEAIMKKVAAHIKQSVHLAGRNLYIVYANPLYKNLFINDGFKEIYHVKKMEYFEMSILSNKKPGL